MPLTPADVHNVAFKKPPIGKRGYDEEEVDAFLDLVEVELASLIEENSKLRAGIVPPAAPEAAASDGADQEAIAALQQHNSQLSEQIGELEGKLKAADAAIAEANQAAQAAQEASAAAAAAQAAPVAAAPGEPQVDHSSAVRVLALAQQTADQHLAEATAEAERLVGEARTSADELLAETKSATDQQINDARRTAEDLDRDSKAQAATTINDAETRRNQIVSELEQQRDALENRLEELRTFEREYRTRLKSYLESQLRELDSSNAQEQEAQRVEG